MEWELDENDPFAPMVRHVRRVYFEMREPELLAMLDVEGADGERFVYGCSWHDESEKMATSMLICNAHPNARGYLFASECWTVKAPPGVDERAWVEEEMRKYGRPMDSPNRSEILTMTCCRRGEKPRERAYEIMRNEDGTVRDLLLEADWTMEPDQFHDRLWTRLWR